MSMMTIKGWLPDPEVLPEHFRFEPFAKPSVHARFRSYQQGLPGVDFDIKHSVPIYDQGAIGSCVLNSVCGAMNIVLDTQENKTDMLSRLFLYWHCRKYMGTKDQDSGTYLWLGADRAKFVGVCNEKTWGYSQANLFQAPTPDCYPEASDNKATAWFKIDGTYKERCDQVEEAVRANHPVIFGTPVDQGIMDYRAGQVLGIPQGPILGGHAMVVTGVHFINGRRVFRIRNSWGQYYGDGGHLLMDEEWMGWPSLTDLWLLTRMDPLLF